MGLSNYRPVQTPPSSREAGLVRARACPAHSQPGQWLEMRLLLALALALSQGGCCLILIQSGPGGKLFISKYGISPPERTPVTVFLPLAFSPPLNWSPEEMIFCVLCTLR